MSDQLYLERPISYYATYLNKFGNSSGPLLDMGCGHGHLLLLAKERGIEAYGVESSHHRIEICKAKGLNVIHHNLCDKLPFPDEFFGMIYCGQVIEHVPPEGQRVMMHEAFRTLKKGGIFQIRSPHRSDEKNRKPGHEYLLTMRELRDLLVNAGFKKPDFAINYPQSVPEIPDFIVKIIWKLYQPELLSASANAIAVKR